MRVLLIDDEPWTRTVTAQALSALGGIEVVEAATGAEGVESACRTRPDCILLDVVLPDCDGTAVLDALQQHDGDVPPVIFVTTLVDERQRDALLARGAAAVLSKPVDLLTLPATVEQIVAASRAPLSADRIVDEPVEE